MEHRGKTGEYAPDCACVSCEKYRAKRGLGLLNPRAALDGPVESRPASTGAEIR